MNPIDSKLWEEQSIGCDCLIEVYRGDVAISSQLSQDLI